MIWANISQSCHFGQSAREMCHSNIFTKSFMFDPFTFLNSSFSSSTEHSLCVAVKVMMHMFVLLAVHIMLETASLSFHGKPAFKAMQNLKLSYGQCNMQFLVSQLSIHECTLFKSLTFRISISISISTPSNFLLFDIRPHFPQRWI